MRKLFNRLFKSHITASSAEQPDENTEPLTSIEFANYADKAKRLWIEFLAIEIDIEPFTSYKILTDDRFFEFTFEPNDSITLYFNNSFSLILYKRPILKKTGGYGEWTLEYDYYHSD
ncbi:hypothetical protein LX99_04171 [Mucilaginibacter oryzae]|uniref:Uncharacterized protein n=1 Tax=Mucilaginibacter oryzae TaxID=468058 RepID=A0A316HIM0_9SPHI|nr:hypothetical protein [Mucilaginibacter oryzae]PWK73785.1 hypothetical protein LX99_04171 [Mucilaginibacter oryzae]